MPGPNPTPLPVPPRLLNTRGRQLVSRLIRWHWGLQLYGTEHLPAHGPVILAANHLAWLDGPLLAVVTPRPVQVWTKHEMFTGPTGLLLRAAGQLELDRDQVDVRAVRQALGVLARGGAVGVFPEGTRGDGRVATLKGGAAYLALVSGAPIVPVAFAGTREATGGRSSLPPRRHPMAMMFGAPLHIEQVPWPRHQQLVRHLSQQLQARMINLIDQVCAHTGLTMPAAGFIEGSVNDDQ